MGGRATMSWLYVGILVGLPVANLVLQALQIGPWPLAVEIAKPEALRALWLTLIVAAITVAANTVFGILLAITIARQRFRGRRLVSLITDLPLTISPVVAGFLLLTLYQPNGWLGRPLEAMGFHVVNALPAIALASMFVTLPYVARELTPLLTVFGHEEEEAATTLGASGWQVFRYITLPNVEHGLTRGMGLTFARCVGEFGAAIVVSGNIIGATQTLTLWVYQEAGDFNYAGAYAGSLVLGLLCVAAFGLAERARRREARIRDLLSHIQ